MYLGLLIFVFSFCRQCHFHVWEWLANLFRHASYQCRQNWFIGTPFNIFLAVSKRVYQTHLSLL